MKAVIAILIVRQCDVLDLASGAILPEIVRTFAWIGWLFYHPPVPYAARPVIAFQVIDAAATTSRPGLIGIVCMWISCICCICCCAAVLLLLAGCGGGGEQAGEQAGESGSSQAGEVEVSVVTAQEMELPRHIRVTGTLFGDEETTIAAKVAGRVVEVIKDLGDAAQPGDPLVRIDPTDYELARQERQRAFQEALARLGLSEMPADDFDVSSVPSVQRARLQSENAKARYDRARALFERDPPLISEQDFDDLKTSWEVAQSNLMVERLNAEATLAEARTLQAQIQIAQQRVQDTVHRAPIEASASATAAASSSASSAGDERGGANGGGRVYEVAARLVSVGDYVQIGAPLVRLVASHPLKLRAQVPERRAGAVVVGQRVIVHAEAFAQPFEARVARISPAVDISTRSFMVEIQVSNPQRMLKPGSFATAQIEVTRERALMLPRSAVITFAGIHKVILVREGKAHEQTVTLGEAVDQLVEIRSGLSASDQVVLTPSADLGTGRPVRVVPPGGNVQASNVAPGARAQTPAPAQQGVAR